MREKELTIRPTDYIPQNAIKSNVIKKRSEEPRVHKVHATGILRYALDDNTSDILYLKWGVLFQIEIIFYTFKGYFSS